MSAKLVLAPSLASSALPAGLLEVSNVELALCVTPWPRHGDQDLFVPFTK
jgi:hypothetical protein